MDKKLLKQLTEIFQGEFGEQVQIMTDCLLDLEKDPDGPESKNNIDKFFRSAHNIKGSAKGLEFEHMGTIAHSLETIFTVLRDGNSKADASLCSLCLEALDAMTILMQAHADEAPLEDFSELLERLDQQVNPESTNIKDTKDIPSGSIKQKDKIDKINDQLTQANSIRVAVDKLIEVGFITEELASIKIKNSDLTYQLKQLQIKVNDMNATWENIVDSVKKKKVGLSDSDLKILYAKLADQDSGMKSHVRNMMYSMRSVNAEFGLTLDSLNENARVLRLMPVSTLLRPLLRTARDIAHELKKPIEVELLGEEVELDRAILEKIKSPLTHLLRNAIDHGIEEPEERQRKKKSEVGKITINVIEEGSEIRIAITDDGGGVDLNQVVEKALNKQLILKEDVEKLSRENILDLLFMPGFSTKNMITDISGRGVGLDVVRTNLQMVKGKVNIDTEEGVSTTITMSFPLTVATDQGILVRVSGQLFIIPTQTVTRIINLKSVGTQAIEGCLSTNLEGQPIPLYYLADILQLQGSRSKIEVDSDMLALVISRGRSTVAFIIDEIIGEREIAIKALMQPLTKSKFITGATISGRGDVILVLHSGDLVDIALESNTGQLSKDSKLEEQTAPNVLLVEDSISTRTLEESIFKNRGYEVTSVVNGSEAWGLLQEKNFDIVVTDVEMPVMNGFELTEKIKNDKRLKDIPVLMVTSLSTEEDKKRGVKAGADAYISKGKFEAAGLLKIVEQLL